MVTNNLMPTADASVMSGQTAQTTQGAETAEASFSEFLQSAAKPMAQTEKIAPTDGEADVSDALIIDGELVKGLDGILKDMLNIVKENEGKDAQGEMLQLLMKLMSGKSDDEENKKANELVMSVLANLVNNGVDVTADTQQPVIEQTAIDAVDFTAAALPVSMTEMPLQPTADALNAQTAVAVNGGENQPIRPETQQTAEKMLDSLLSYAKENLGLSGAELTAARSEQPQTAEQLKQSFGFTYIAADTVDSAKTGELEQLIANLGGRQTENVQQPTAANSTAQPEQAAAQTAEQPVQQTTQLSQDNGAQTDSSSSQSERKQTTENAVAANAEGLFTAEAQPEPQTEPTRTAARPAEVQVTQAIADRLSQNADNTEFTLELNPGNLGRVTVKLTADSEGKIAVQITASNPETQKLLDARAENVQQSLRQNGVELEKYQVVYSADEAAFNEQSYDGSSKNPYLRQQNDSDENSSDTDFADILSSM